MVLKRKNIELEEMLEQLEPVLSNRDKTGYVAARNTRIIRDALTEFVKFRSDLIKEYGQPELDNNDKPTGRVFVSENTPNIEDFHKKFDELANIEHDVDIMTLKYDEVIGILSGEEILNLDWMLED